MTNEEAIKAIKANYPSGGYERLCEALDMAIKVLAERKTGRWARQTDDYYDYYECENCGIAVGLDDIRNYCPCCGAKMEGEADAD